MRGRSTSSWQKEVSGAKRNRTDARLTHFEHLRLEYTTLATLPLNCRTGKPVRNTARWLVRASFTFEVGHLGRNRRNVESALKRRSLRFPLGNYLLFESLPLQSPGAHLRSPAPVHGHDEVGPVGPCAGPVGFGRCRRMIRVGVPTPYHFQVISHCASVALQKILRCYFKAILRSVDTDVLGRLDANDPGLAVLVSAD